MTTNHVFFFKLNVLWADKYAPRDAESLAVHKKKVAEVRTWLVDTKAELQKVKGMGNFGLRFAEKILVLTGPPGCGKTTTLKVLCDELKMQFVEYFCPLQVMQRDVDGRVRDYQSQMSYFEEFLVRGFNF